LGAIDPISGPVMQKMVSDVYDMPPAILAKTRDAVKLQ
jgi:hypothetical protein